MPAFPAISEQARVRRLALPSGKVRMVLDTDTYNEIDDQFAVAYAMLSPQHMEVEAIYAAPFFNRRCSGPGDGMEKSYEEILRLLELLDRRHEGFAFKGSDRYLPSPEEPVRSPAAEDLVRRAMSGDEPLYVVAIGAPTNLASAMLIEPAITERIVVVWLGGNPLYWPHADEFNLGQDLPASRLLFDCGVPLVNIPCMNVAEHLRTTVPELEKHLKGKGGVGDYLFTIFCDYCRERRADLLALSKVIWDISAVAFLINPQWVPTELVHSPILTERVTYSIDRGRHLIRMATHTERDAIFGDLFRKVRAGDNVRPRP